MDEYKYPMCSDEYKESADITHRISCQLRTASKHIKGMTIDQATILFSNIIHAVNYWTGSTYVGSKKKPGLEKAYQAFFKALYDFILSFRTMDKPIFHECADMILYQGTVYRYLGHHSGDENKEKIEPTYNDIYVSWSKEPENSHIESKLYGTMTWMSADIQEPFYGIDLEGLEEAIYQLVGIECSLTRGNEREVVFPTVEECITEIKYIEPGYEEDEEDEQT